MKLQRSFYVLEKNRNLYEKLRKISIEVSKNFNFENSWSNLVENVKYVLKIKKLQ
jgi:hypothetical protein